MYGGQLRQGNFRLPIAIKLQRDLPLTWEQNESVVAKFDTERAVYLRIHAKNSTVKAETPIAQYYDLAPVANDTACPEIPPSVVCPHARYALNPRCPKCKELLEVDEWRVGDDRGLLCPNCQQTHHLSKEKKREIERATARRDAGCEGCTQTDEECRKSATILNFFLARVLALELLDLDLEDFL